MSVEVSKSFLIDIVDSIELLRFDFMTEPSF